MTIKLNAATGGGSVSLSAPNSTTSNLDVELTLPVDDGAANTFLKSDGSGTLSWAAASSDSITEGNTTVECVDTGSDGHITFDTEGSEAMRVDSSQRVLIGDTSAGGTGRYLTVGNTSSANTYLEIRNSTSGDGGLTFADSAGGVRGMVTYSHGTDNLDIWAAGSNRMRLYNDGALSLYGNTTVLTPRSGAAASGSTELIYCTRGATNVTNGTGVFAVYTNGSYATLSDQTRKKNIETTRDGYLDDLNRLRVVKYNWNEQEDGDAKELGLIAQEVEQVFPGLINEMRSEDEETGEETSIKGIKYSVLPVMLLKALQEATAKIETLETANASLEARLTALEGGAS